MKRFTLLQTVLVMCLCLPSIQAASSFTLMAFTNVWRYDVSATDLGTAWRATNYNDSAWPSGRGVLAFENNNATVTALTNTVLPLRTPGNVFITNFYFRTHFTLTNDPSGVLLISSNLIDDGAVFYINGTEFARVRMTVSAITANTFASVTAPEGSFTNMTIPSALLVAGDNVLAVEVHQADPSSSDIVFGTAVIVSPLPEAPPTITLQPASANVWERDGAAFTVTVNSLGTPQFQWFKSGAAIVSATNSTLSFSNAQFSDVAEYFLVASNSYGATTSSVAFLNVLGTEARLRLVEFTNAWRFNDSGNSLGTAWRATNYNDSAWALGRGLFVRLTDHHFPEPINNESIVPYNGYTVYFRTHFTVPSGATNLLLVASNLLDDGAVFYLDGTEVARIRVSGTVDFSTMATSSPTQGKTYETWSLNAPNLGPGDHLLAVELHQSSPTASDHVFGMNLLAYPSSKRGPMIVSPLAPATLNEGTTLALSADVFGSQKMYYQWLRNGAALAGETNVSLRLDNVHPAQAGDYAFTASNAFGAVTSAVAPQSVLADQTPPAVAAVFLTNDQHSVVVVFSERVSEMTATNLANYFIAGTTILSARMIGLDRVLLITSELDVQLDYSLAVSNVTDTAETTHTMVPVTSIRIGRDARYVAPGLLAVQTVFVILMENVSWSSIKGNANLPYLNSLLPLASYCENYHAPGDGHPSQPNYIWLEAGEHFGYDDDDGPAASRVSSTNHLSTQLTAAGLDWRGYMESLPYGSTGVADANPYLARHNPFAFFEDVTTNYPYCTNHVRPYAEFAGDLAAGGIGRYNFISPNVTNDMHSLAVGSTNRVRQGDDWLSRELPQILQSSAFSNNGAVFITWDENDYSTNYPIGMIVLSPLAKGHGYATTRYYDHSSTLRTMQDIFGVRPYLGAAANALPLNDLFVELTLTPVHSNSTSGVTVSGTLPGRTNYLQASFNLVQWTTIHTNTSTNAVFVLDSAATGQGSRFYRAVQAN